MLLDILDAAFQEYIVSCNDGSVTKWRCVSCDVPFKKSQHAKNHLESKHMEGLQYPCTECPTICKTKASLHMHMKRKHRQNPIEFSFSIN